MKMMKKRSRFVAAILAVWMPLWAMGAGASEAAPEVRAVLDAFRTSYVREWVRGSADAMLGFYAEEVRLMPPFAGTVLGKANAAAYHRAWLGRFRVLAYRRDPRETLDLGGRIVETGRYAMRMVEPSDGSEHELAGGYMTIWTNGDGAAPALVSDVWTLENYPALGDRLRLPEVPAVLIAFRARVPVRGGVSFELAALNHLHEVAVVQHDAAMWSQFFADDAILFPNFGAICVGREAIDAYLEKHAKQLPIFEKLDVRNDQVDDLGQFVIEYASHVANWRNGDASGVNTGKNIRVWRRGPNGALRLFRQIGNYD